MSVILHPASGSPDLRAGRTAREPSEPPATIGKKPRYRRRFRGDSQLVLPAVEGVPQCPDRDNQAYDTCAYAPHRRIDKGRACVR